MVLDRRTWRRVLLVVGAVLFLVAVFALCWRERYLQAPLYDHQVYEPVYEYTVEEVSESGCFLGVPVLTEDVAATIGTYVYRDYSDLILFADQPAAIDVAASEIYISQSLSGGDGLEQLRGGVELVHGDAELYFAPDAMYSDLSAAIAQGHGFRLLIVDDTEYMEYKVVLTTLPVLRLDGGYSHVDAQTRDVYYGDVCLWAPAEESGYTVYACDGLWNIRGAGTIGEPKKSWKLQLVDEKRQNMALSFLGLGADDDWIINSMIRDDTKMKEKLSMEVWNNLAACSPWNEKMSQGEYVELVLNGEFYGLLLLQRRVDEAYLDVKADEVLFKGRNTLWARNPEDGYEIEYSPFSDVETYDLMSGVQSQADCSVINKDNFVDVHLFIQWGSMQDNEAYKNMFYHFRKLDEELELILVPWDTDFSMGIQFDNAANAFVYDFEGSLQLVSGRTEYQAMTQMYPNLDAQLSRRWKELRKSVYSEAYIGELMNTFSNELTSSGAMERDNNRWGLYYHGADNAESLRRFVAQRLIWMDQKYS